MVGKPEPVSVLYCTVCTLSAEYCEYGPDFAKCKPWLVQNAPNLYPDLVKDATEKEVDRVADQLSSAGISYGSGDDATTSSAPKEEVKRLPGGKVKKKFRGFCEKIIISAFGVWISRDDSLQHFALLVIC